MQCVCFLSSRSWGTGESVDNCYTCSSPWTWASVTQSVLYQLSFSQCSHSCSRFLWSSWFFLISFGTCELSCLHFISSKAFQKHTHLPLYFLSLNPPAFSLGFTLCCLLSVEYSFELTSSGLVNFMSEARCVFAQCSPPFTPVVLVASTNKPCQLIGRMTWMSRQS